METVAAILNHLQEAGNWPDGEPLVAIRERLTPEQLAAPGSIIIRIAERGPLPWLVRALVTQDDSLLFEVAQRLPKSVTHEIIEEWVKAWQARGYFQEVTVHNPLTDQASGPQWELEEDNPRTE